jgi:glutamate N-acetyltransferase/amino-acid N-acetyltransferase
MVDVDSSIQSVKGFRVAGVHAGLKKDGARDFALIVSDRNCVSAGVFTRNQVKAACVYLNMHHIQANPGQMRAVVINTKCANACTGPQGMVNAQDTAEFVAEAVGCKREQVFVMSTGVIGTQLPMDKIKHGVELSFAALARENWEDAAEAMMTTDTRPKLASIKTLTVDGQYTIAGISKGAGMIAPNMATMLGVIVTDAILDVEMAQQFLKEAVNVTFNRIVVDGDTSTNDMVILMANGASNTRLQTDYDIQQFQTNLTAVCRKLAQDIVRDGEGATKFITLHITGAADDKMADKIAHTIATSALVKTAFFGNDANWGRIIAAAGRAGVEFNPNQARLWMSPGEELYEGDPGLLLFEKGMPTDYSEHDASEIIREPSVYVTLDCGDGEGEAIIWTCDLSHDYVSINAEYRT